MTQTVVAPPAPAKTRASAPRLDLDKKIDLLCALCQIQKPEHRRIDQVLHPFSGQMFGFHPGKVLNCLIDYVLPNAQNQQKQLNLEQEAKLYSLHWFSDWRQGILTARSTGPNGAEPLLDEKVMMFLNEYRTVPMAAGLPRRKVVWTKALAPRTAQRKNGGTYELHGFRLMEKLAPLWWPSKDPKTKPLQLEDTAKQDLEKLHWFPQWQQDGEQRRIVAHMRKVVTKEQKLDLLVQHYNLNLDGTPRSKPSWNDIIPVPHTAVRDSIGTVVSVWEFKPATFLDDLVDNWVVSGRPGVTLTDKQKRMLEELPWVKDWLRAVFTGRERRRVLRGVDSSDSESDLPSSKRSKPSSTDRSVASASSSSVSSPSIASEWSNPPTEGVVTCA